MTPCRPTHFCFTNYQHPCTGVAVVLLGSACTKSAYQRVACVRRRRRRRSRAAVGFLTGSSMDVRTLISITLRPPWDSRILETPDPIHQQAFRQLLQFLIKSLQAINNHSHAIPYLHANSHSTTQSHHLLSRSHHRLVAARTCFQHPCNLHRQSAIGS